MQGCTGGGGREGVSEAALPRKVAHVVAASGATGVICEPRRHVVQVAPVATPLTPNVQAPNRGFAARHDHHQTGGERGVYVCAREREFRQWASMHTSKQGRRHSPNGGTQTGEGGHCVGGTEEAGTVAVSGRACVWRQATRADVVAQNTGECTQPQPPQPTHQMAHTIGTLRQFLHRVCTL